jgi:serine/threonine-protein kinase
MPFNFFDLKLISRLLFSDVTTKPFSTAIVGVMAFTVTSEAQPIGQPKPPPSSDYIAGSAKDSGKKAASYRLYDEAVKSYAKGRFATVVEQCMDAINCDDSNAAVFVLRGMAYQKQNKLELAMQDFQKSLLLEPENLLGLQNRAMLRIQCGDNTGALEDIEQGIKLSPSNAYSMYLRGYYLELILDHENAVSNLNRALELNPNLAEAYTCRACAYSNMNRLVDAIDDFSSAIRLANSSDDYLLRAGAYYASGKYEKSLHDYEMSSKIDRNVKSLIGIANVLSSCPLADVRNGKRAIELAKNACEQTKWTNGEALDALAAAYAENGQFDNAVKYEKRAIGKASNSSQEILRKHKLALFEQNSPYRCYP